MRWTDCENNLLEHLATGEMAYCGPSQGEVDGPPEDAGTKRMAFDVDAELIRWLCVDPAVSKLIDPKGIQLHSARIVGQLDLSYVTVPFPLIFRNSRFVENINLAHSRLLTFDLSGSQVGGITADGLKGEDVYLRKITAHGMIRFPEADLSGDLDCEAGTFKNPGGIALGADGLKAARVILQNSIVDGEVDLPEASLSGDLDALGATFYNPDGDALFADFLRANSVYLRKSNAEGKLRLSGAYLAGNLECDGATLKNPGKYALLLDGLTARNVFLRNGFSAHGEIHLNLANLSGDLDCHDASFKNPNEVALSADLLRANNVYLRDSNFEGQVRLVGANLGGNLECDGAALKNPIGYALSADGLKASGNVIFRRGFSAEGIVSLVLANVRGFLQWINMVTDHRDGVVLDLRHATVGPFADDEQSWPRQGNLKLDGFVYSSFGSAFGGPQDAASRLRWLGLQGTGVFIPQPYEQLAKVLRENGDDAGATAVLIAMDNARRQYGNLSWWERGWSWILYETIRYGYNTWQALWFIGGFVIFGAFLFFFGHRFEGITQIDKEDIEHSRPFNPLVYSLETFLPLVDLQQAKHWAPKSEGSKFGRCLRWYLWLHILMGWFFTSMLIAGITGLVQKG